MSAYGAAIEAVGIDKVFRDFWGRPRIRAVQGLSFEVRRGEVFGLLGPNGSGKSTTMKMILGLLYPSAGRIRVLGEAPNSIAVKARIGFMPEESPLYPYLTAEETLDFFGRLFGLPPARRRQRTDELLEMIGLAHARKRYVGDFSKGMARRISLAQALINDPDLVLLDEPTAGMDPIGCRQFKDLILALARRGKTVLLSSHLLGDVEDVCSRLAILAHGEVCAEGTVDALLERQASVRLTFPSVGPEACVRIESCVRAEAPGEIAWDHPRRSLEEFFLEAVRRPRGDREGAMSGAGEGGRLAPFLAEGAAPAGGEGPGGKASS